MPQQQQPPAPPRPRPQQAERPTQQAPRKTPEEIMSDKKLLVSLADPALDRADLVCDKAEGWARLLVEYDRTRETTVARATLRKYFHEVKALTRETGDFAPVRMRVRMLIPHVAYDRTRPRSSVGPVLEKFIRHFAAQIDGPDALKTFGLLFEAVLGFAYAHLAKKEKRSEHSRQHDRGRA